MVLKLSKSALPQLLPWLRRYLPHSFKLHGDLKSHLRGKFPDLDFYVDRWPDPEAVAARVDPTGGQLHGDLKSHLRGKFPDLDFFVDRWPDPEAVAARVDPTGGHLKCRDFYSNKVPGVFGVTDEALTALLKDKRLHIDWSKPTEFIDVVNSNWSALKALSQDMGTSVQIIPGFLIKVTPQDIRPVPVPEGMKIQPVSEDYVHIVYSTWKFSGEHTEMFIRHLVEQHPSIVLTTDTGQHVGHLLGQSYGGMGMLYIQPEFRRKGYAKVIISQLMQKYLEMGEDVYMVIETDNSTSLNMSRFLNKPVPNVQIACRVTSTPKEC